MRKNSGSGLTNCENGVMLDFISSRGVVANRLGNGLQNRLDRFDSGPRLHFFASVSASSGTAGNFAGGIRVFQPGKTGKISPDDLT